jgi:hypothetical protein
VHLNLTLVTQRMQTGILVSRDQRRCHGSITTVMQIAFAMDCVKNMMIAVLIHWLIDQ